MRDATLVTVAGREPAHRHGPVNPPISRASTILFPSVEAYERARTHEGITYGRAGTSTTYAFEEALAALEGGHRSIALASGKAACNLVLAALTQAGDHILVVDSVYAPTRQFCDRTLARFGVETSYYDPRLGAEIDALIRPNTRLIFLESPGSLTFEVQDVPAIVEVAKKRGVLTAIDNTWATPVFFKPLACGVDISIQAVTKYIGGHSDLMMGAVTTGEAIHMFLRQRIYEFGAPASPEDCWLALRGLRTLVARLERHQKSALEVARWLERRPEVARVLYPALESHPDHSLWRRDFTGASGLFGLVLKPFPKKAVCAMVDGLQHFGIGASWGGFESLVLVTYPERWRTAVPWRAEGPTLRLHIGLEDPEDLIRDLEAGFQRLQAEARS
ncbi:Cystathionine beta-lyase MetC [bacterium HR40]|nr:Cystathionine beta-lyase MetC [bacterium HR40]